MSISRKLYVFLIASLLIFSISSCGSGTDTNGSGTDTDGTDTEQNGQTQEEQAPDIPHVLDGRDDCLGCHNTATLLAVPADHQGRTNDLCRACHEQVSNPSSAMGPAIPHSLEGRDNCLLCHSAGGEAVPSSHAGRTSSVCQACHQAES